MVPDLFVSCLRVFPPELAFVAVDNHDGIAGGIAGALLKLAREK
jgi:hypothetical protein